jgi:beta-glucanase (GH16 family)
MNVRILALGFAVAIVVTMALAQYAGSGNQCLPGSREPECRPTPDPTLVAGSHGPSAGSPMPSGSGAPSASPGQTAIPSTAPTPAPTEVAYTFRDEFGGRQLADHWGRHWPGIGAARWSRSQTRVADGVLTITARTTGNQHVSDLVDTYRAFSQRYGVFSARMRFSEGVGLWPAFWLSQPPDGSGELREIDIAEVCAYPPGMHERYDASVLRMYVHDVAGANAFANAFQTVNLSGQWHVYSMTWRPGFVAFFLDGVEIARYDGAEVPRTRMVIVLNLAVGGSFCPATGATPAVGTLEVDWVRVTR